MYPQEKLSVCWLCWLHHS